eukprot:GHVR01037924.1.p1 GENE.GHVR01037924.1~~GHVR01037924.1.p1  ORF type:complete len:117 (+),score=2.27 GHVR01037924.1:36-386(+)
MRQRQRKLIVYSVPVLHRDADVRRLIAARLDSWRKGNVDSLLGDLERTTTQQNRRRKDVEMNKDTLHKKRSNRTGRTPHHRAIPRRDTRYERTHGNRTKRKTSRTVPPVKPADRES